MNKIACELCGGNQLVKQDNMFVCQGCGTQYSLEDARKMIILGTINVADTVKVDNSDYVDGYLQNARRAKQKEDWEEAKKYYTMVEQCQPDNIEAIFNSAYAKARFSLGENDMAKRQTSIGLLINSLKIIYNMFDDSVEYMALISGISTDILNMVGSIYHKRTISLFNTLGFEFIKILEMLALKYSEDQIQKQVSYYQLAIIHAEWILYFGRISNKRYVKNKIKSYHILIREMQPSYEIKTVYDVLPAPPKEPKSILLLVCAFGAPILALLAVAVLAFIIWILQMIF